MEPEGSSPHSQEPATCPYPEPDWSSPCHPIQPLEDPSRNLITLEIIFSNSYFSDVARTRQEVLIRRKIEERSAFALITSSAWRRVVFTAWSVHCFRFPSISRTRLVNGEI